MANTHRQTSFSRAPVAGIVLAIDSGQMKVRRMEQQRRSPPQPRGGFPASAAGARLAERARCKFIEMPGLSLTAAQAARLFGLEPGQCLEVLHALVADGTLRQAGAWFCRDSAR